MQLPIETWVAEAGLPQEANVAFAEAVRCYKAGAYRAALLFSYTGWGLSLRRRVLLAPCPSGFSANLWNDIGEKLRNEGRWEAQIFDCSQMKQPASIFEVSDDLRLQVKFWRDRRNDCAHFKINDIGSAYVESFWQFVRSNILRFMPRGTRGALIEEIGRFFDPNQTPPGSDVRHVAELIGPSIEPGQLEDFFREVVSSFTVVFGSTAVRSYREPAILFEGVLAVNQSHVVNALVSFLEREEWLLLPLLRSNPSRVLNWANHRSLIRRLWRELLFEQGQQDLPVFAALLRNDLIPKGEVPEANLWVVTRLNGDVPSSENLDVLLSSGFIDRLRRYMFDEYAINQFAWGNRNASTVRWFLETFVINSTIARIICSVFHSPPYPYDVRDALAALFSSNSSKREELEASAREVDAEVPRSILSESR